MRGEGKVNYICAATCCDSVSPTDEDAGKNVRGDHELLSLPKLSIKNWHNT